MPRMIDQIRASKLPSNMMQFAARGALQVSPAENIEILVYLARHNKVFGDLARMTLAGWDEKASLAAAADPQSPREVLDYLISPDNLAAQAAARAARKSFDFRRPGGEDRDRRPAGNDRS